MKSSHSTLLLLLLISCTITLHAKADQLRGEIRSISLSAKTIEILDFSTGQSKLFRTSPATVFLNAFGLDDLNENEKVEIQFKPENELQRIKRIVAYVPEHQIITTNELQVLINNPAERYLLFDTRTWDQYQAGHLPSAIWAPAVNTSRFQKLLPLDKNQTILFYDEGLTSETAPSAARELTLAGYRNIKVYAFGLSTWRKNKLPIVVNSSWLSENQGPQIVLVDTRIRERSMVSHIKGAIAMPGTQLLQTLVRNPTLTTLAGLPEKNARVTLYGDTTYDDCILDLYRELLSRDYKNIVILEGGLKAWSRSYSIEQSPAPAAFPQ